MIKAIDKKYCRGNLVQLMPITSYCHLITSADEIILLKIGDKVLVNKYINHPKRDFFPYNEKEQNDKEHFTELFEYNKTYLNFRFSVRRGFSVYKDYFFKGSKRALWLEESLQVDDRYAQEKFTELNRNSLERIFDSSNYDSMYVIDINRGIIFARNDKEKIHIGENIIPSNDKIVKMDLEKRQVNYSISKALTDGNYTEESYQEANTPKTVDEIKNLKIYKPLSFFSKYSHLLLTIRDGKFDLTWFRIDFIEKDKFKFTFSPITITEPTVDDVMGYANNNEIENTPEPSKPTPTFAQVHTLKNQEMAMNTTSDLNADINGQEQEQSASSENGVFMRLQKMFKRYKPNDKK